MKINASIPHTHHSPAKAARDLLAARTDLATQPFGQLVSKFARGEQIAPATPATTATVCPPTEDSSSTESTGTPAAQTIDISI